MNNKSITLYQPDAAFGLPSPSAFCVKLETYLRMADIPYQVASGDPRQAPKGKVPWITDGNETIADSGFIIAYLKQHYGDPLDSKLAAEQRALGHAIQRMLEESLYFVSSYSRWVEDEGFKIYSDALFQKMPGFLKLFVPNIVRKKAIKKFKAQGIGRHSREEVYQLGIEDIHSFAQLLGDKDYLFGNEPTSFDASAFGVIGNMIKAPFENPAKQAALSHANIVEYTQRIRKTYFKELT